MPNDCWNHITMTFKDTDELDQVIENELKANPSIKILEQGKKGIIIKLTSDWKPDFKWLECLILKYPSSWIKNEWKEEGGTAGVAVRVHGFDFRRGGCGLAGRGLAACRIAPQTMTRLG